MRLQSLELVGFKTFADATRLAFDRGITTIIGPNGSGKSNCADALLWVLAERRLSMLRAGEGTDVIFAGSSGRRPLGYAEVTLTVDNTDGTLPVELQEVSVTRRVHRNGDNEYLINRRRCRRKDVVDLFLDTGVGRHGLSVISQREVDAILSLEPGDRRRLLEEVAGIERYRSRREETLRRLEETQTNLTRLGDIMLGLQLQLEPLEQQKEQAERYLGLKRQADGLRLSLLVKDYQLLERRLLRSDEELAEHRDAVAASRTALAEAEAAEERGRLDVLRLDEELTALRAALGEAARQADEQQTRLRVGEERQQNLSGRLTDARGSLARLVESAARRQAEAAEAGSELTSLTDELTKAQGDLAEREAAIGARRAEESQAEAALGDRRRTQQELATRAGRLESAKQAAEQTLAQLATRRQEGARRCDELALARQQAEQRQAEATAAVADAQAAQNAARDAHQHAIEELQRADRERNAVRERLADFQARLGEAEARWQVRQQAADSYDGLYRGVKAVLQARDRGRLRGDYQAVADILQVDDGCDVAIEAALGARLQDLVCETGEDARAAIEFLKQDRSGRATFLPLDILEVPAAPRELLDLRGRPGVVGPALDLVQTAAEFDGVRRHLLTTIVVVEDLEAGLAIRRRGAGRLTLVTLDGDLIRPGGQMTGGSREAAGPALLTRRRELERLEQERQRCDAALRAARQQEQALAATRQAAQAGVNELQTALEQRRRELSEAERRRLEVGAALNQATGDLARWSETSGHLDEDAGRAEATIRQAEVDLAELARRREAAAAALAEGESAAAARRAERAAQSEALAAARVVIARLESRLHAERETARRRQQAEREAAEEQGRLERAIAIWDRELGELAESLRGWRAEWTERHGAREERQQALSAKQAMRQDAARLVEQSTAGSRQARQALAEAQEATHRAELRRTQADSELVHLQQTLADDHDGLTIEQARQRAMDLPNRQDAADELARLRAAIDELGDVNLGAVEEFERVTERLLFYEKQRGDLQQARQDLLEVIAEIDDLTVERLDQAFSAVNREFTAMFTRVFGGDGHAELLWTDPDDILNSGLEVLARLPGKRAQNILLLSGGERAMTTITLLLAMFKVKPSPFCLLDELDAPLDEANLRKYVELLREFSAISQFIVITHNPETARAADALYGITMQEPGVSRVYSYRLPADDEPEAYDEAAAAD